jgi:hypothetical protein
VFVTMLLVQLFTLTRAESVAVQSRHGWRKDLLLSDVAASSWHARVRLHDWKATGEGRPVSAWETLPVARASPLCPVRALSVPCAARAQAYDGRPAPLFVLADRSPVSYDMYRSWLRRRAAWATGAGSASIGTNSIRSARRTTEGWA